MYICVGVCVAVLCNGLKCIACVCDSICACTVDVTSVQISIVVWSHQLQPVTREHLSLPPTQRKMVCVCMRVCVCGWVGVGCAQCM